MPGLEGEAREAAIAKIKAEIAKNREKVMNSGEVIELEPPRVRSPPRPCRPPAASMSSRRPPTKAAASTTSCVAVPARATRAARNSSSASKMT